MTLSTRSSDAGGSGPTTYVPKVCAPATTSRNAKHEAAKKRPTVIEPIPINEDLSILFNYVMGVRARFRS